MSILRALLSIYNPRLATILVYMLQVAGYRPLPYLASFWQTHDFSQILQGRQLTQTRPARWLRWFLRIGIVMHIAASVTLLAVSTSNDIAGGWQFAVTLLLAYPVVWAHLVIVPVYVGRLVRLSAR